MPACLQLVRLSPLEPSGPTGAESAAEHTCVG